MEYYYTELQLFVIHYEQADAGDVHTLQGVLALPMQVSHLVLLKGIWQCRAKFRNVTENRTKLQSFTAPLLFCSIFLNLARI